MAGRVKRHKQAVSDLDIGAFRQKLLNWYDRQGRDLPWRLKGKERPAAYAIWLSEIMMQQTTIPMGTPYYLKFLKKWPTVQDLAAAPIEDVMHEWAGLGYYARARNLHKCAGIISREYNGEFPAEEKELLSLPGIGPYTAAAISAIVFNQPATVVDGNVERVVARVFAVTAPIPDSKKVLKEKAGGLSAGRTDRPGDFAQGMMDLGAMLCTPTSPKCDLCPVRDFCEGHVKGIAETLPARKPKSEKPRKYGYVYWIENRKGEILFERRPEKAMMGGMLGLPTSEWQPKKNSLYHLPQYGNAHTEILKSAQVRHSFTHFDLELTICRARQGKKAEGLWISRHEIATLGLPTLFRKAVKLMV